MSEVKTAKLRGLDTDALQLGDSAAGTLLLAQKSITAPNKPACLAFLASTIADATGNGAEYNILLGSEVYDQGGDFTPGLAAPFTAPVAGKYRVSLCVSLIDLSTAATYAQLRLSTSNRSYAQQCGLNPKSGALEFGLAFTCLVDMDAGDTLAAFVTVSGMAGDTADVYGDNSGTLRTFLSVALEA